MTSAAATRSDTGARRRLVLVEVGIVALLVVTLLAFGQPLVCRCGEIALWVGNTFSDQNSQQVADPYSFTHITHGVAFFWALTLVWRTASFDLRLIAATAIEAAWEAVENTDAVINRYRETTVSLGYFGDSAINSAFDVLFCIAGFVIASRLSGRVSALAVVAMEVALLATIRDSLLLNIVMLLLPIPAVREWQFGG